jgi:hypothetical protein
MPFRDADSADVLPGCDGVASAVEPELLSSYTVDQKVVAIPHQTQVGVLSRCT